MSRPLYRVEGIRRIEQLAGRVEPSLMERAGAAAAAAVEKLLPERPMPILVLAGPGDNGGDARIAARILAARFHDVTVADAAHPPPARPWGVVVDGLFGIGLSRPIEGPWAALVEAAHAHRGPVLALDVPSGLAADTGRVLGRAVRATHTITFLALKPGLLTLEGPDHCGAVSVAELGVEAESLVPPQGRVIAPELFVGRLRRRPHHFHKGQAGSLAILGGASGMIGAALLAGRAALALGAGRVYLGLLAHAAPPVDACAPELMPRPPDETLGLELDAVVAGPGLGQSERAEALVAAVLASDLPCVLDADALNLIAASADLRGACARRRAATLVTPHPAEAARLLGVAVAEVQNDRIEAATRIAARLGAHTLLKGAGSVVAAPEGRWYLNTTGNPGMASAGMGDVLAGLCGALLAQGLEAEAALCLAAHLHGAAADELASSGGGPVGIRASETIGPARKLWNAWLAAYSQR